jgi:hypothetical protein
VSDDKIDERPMATATCSRCDWTIRHPRGVTAADDLEVAKFLRRELLEHVRLKHADNWKRGKR